MVSHREVLAVWVGQLSKRAFAGNKMLATARDIESLRELSERYGDQVKLFELDVTDDSSAAGAVKTAIDTFGSLDVVINNAGYGNLSSVEDTPMSDFRPPRLRQLQNLTSTGQLGQFTKPKHHYDTV
jgi:NAD(P)-dependent dehydrogenase (short-subunit alcohol dehydrogenase family)